MTKVWVILISFLLVSCSNQNVKKEIINEQIICEKTVVTNNDDSQELGGYYYIGYVIFDDYLNREVHVREYLRDNFVSEEEYANYMKYLQNMYVTNLHNQEHRLAIFPYYKKDRIVYPHTILDYTDLSLYTEDEIPMEVRTEDGQAIVFDLYWEYIIQSGLLDDFTCTLQVVEE